MSDYSPAEVASARVALGCVRGAMDEYAREIFDLWFSGSAPAEVLLDDPKWADYMRREPRLPGQIRSQLQAYAEQARDAVEAQPGRLQRPFKLTFHAEVGGPDGGYRTGYNVLHGSDRTVGDFVVAGQMTATRPAIKGGPYTATFTGLSFVFNDVVNANRKFRSDVVGRTAATNVAATLGQRSPRDYVLRIKWSQPTPVSCAVPAFVKGQAPAWLKTFPNH